MAENGGTSPKGPRCIALVGPFQSGKTTLLEAILARTGAIARQGTVEAGSTVGDASAEARHHKMSVELSVATTNFLGDTYTFIDCPGSVEFIHDMRAALPAIDAAVVVCEADEKKVPQLQLILRELEELKIPRFLFLNKIDKADKRVRETLSLLQPASRVPLVLRQIPIWTNDIVIGFVDLALERAHIYKEHAPSEVVPLEGDNTDRNKEARFTMLESLADHDDELMEQLLNDIPPPRDKVFDDLAQGAARRPDLPGADRLGDAHQRRAAPDEGAAPRGAGRRRYGEAPRRHADRRCGRLRAQDAAHRAWRQDVGRARAHRTGRRRHHLHHAGRRGRPRLGRVQDARPQQREARRRGRRRNRRARQARTRQDRRHAHRRQAGAQAGRAGDALSAGAGDRDLRQGTQGRREARPGAQQAAGRRPLADRGAQSRDARDRGVGAGRDAPARRDRAARRPLHACRSSGASRASAIARRSRSRCSTCAAGTRSSRAATASSATS